MNALPRLLMLSLCGFLLGCGSDPPDNSGIQSPNDQPIGPPVAKQQGKTDNKPDVAEPKKNSRSYPMSDGEK